MKLFQDVKRKLLGRMSPKLLITAILGSIFALVPNLACAAEGNVVLRFSNQDKIYLYGSLVLGLAALVYAWILAKGVLRQSPGSESMRSVGLAIKEGALAYLRKQVGTMSIFVVLLAVVLLFLYKNQYNSWNLGIEIAVTFIAGVAASYIAGYVGMLMAVEGNMRTANAALTSYKSTLEVAFRSGAVAGMVTVGMGLMGATAIFLLTGENAMKLLVGFGFGGSLAALFMRVGGGIFTKAADVGADLVGKVEAGIPEDDPRNPATIADNVGDNVGDCAGMAADVFESYEVTLVAAIILGAATAAIFDQTTWMRLIIFALLARGVGIIASMIGIGSVRGNDDLDSDPLKAIRKGFWTSAAIAAAGTAALAFWLMGGMKDKIVTSQLRSPDEFRLDDIRKLQSIRSQIAAAKKISPTEVKGSDMVEDPWVQNTLIAAGKPSDPTQLAQFKTQMATQVSQMAETDLEAAPKPKDLSSYRVLDLNSNDPVLDYAVQNPAATPGTPQFQTVKKAFAEGLIVAKVHVSRVQDGSDPKAPKQAPQEQDVWVGPVAQAELKKNLDQANSQKTPGFKSSIVMQETYPVTLYKGGNDDLALVYSGTGIARPQEVRAAGNMQYYPVSVGKMEDLSKSTDPNVVRPNPKFPVVGVAEHKDVPWYMFFACIFFGIIMAFAIEILTDYYVSTHKKPVQEIAGVSNAGPAPMIIQGFALASESSVFSVLAIVVALIMPLIFFPPGDYGGSYLLSFYGIALVGLGLLTTTGYILAMDTFGPISDNAQGVFEMSGAGHTSVTGSKAVQRLDAAGNTTKALTKGFAIATAVVAAVALFHSYVEDSMLTGVGMRLEIPEIFLGLLIGGAAPYLFSAFSINAVGRASFQLIEEVRTQFRNDPGIMAGTSKPDYGRCVGIVTQAAQKELLGPGILAIFLPVAVAFGFSYGKAPVTINGHEYNLVGAQALGGFLAGAIVSGQLLAVLLANSGGMWDNAKKLIEDGLYGGKGSEAHKAGVVCDTVGDPFKDTAGPAMNPLIKVMNLVGLLLAPIVIRPMANSTLATVTLVSLGLLAFSIYYSKRSSLSSALSSVTEAASHTPLAYEEHHEAAPSTSSKKRITVEDSTDDTPEA